MEIRAQLNQIKSSETPSDAAIYGKIKRGLTGELLAYSDTLDHTVTKLEEKITFLQQKANSLRTSQAPMQAFATHAPPSKQARNRDRNRDQRGNNRSSASNNNSKEKPKNKHAPDQHQPPRNTFRCPFHRTNRHTQAECRAIKDLMSANSAQAAASPPKMDDDPLFAWSSNIELAAITDERDAEINPTLDEFYEALHATSASSSPAPFRVDSAASHHMIVDKHAFRSYSLLP